VEGGGGGGVGGGGGGGCEPINIPILSKEIYHLILRRYEVKKKEYRLGIAGALAAA